MRIVSAESLPSCGFPAGSVCRDCPPGRMSPLCTSPRWHFVGHWVSSPSLLLSALKWGSGCGCRGHFTVVLGLKPICLWFCFSGVPVSSRVSAKIQQLVNTLKRPKRPPLREFFVDDFEELLEGKRTLFRPHLFQCLCDPINYNGIFSTMAIFLFKNKTESYLEPVGTVPARSCKVLKYIPQARLLSKDSDVF